MYYVRALSFMLLLWQILVMIITGFAIRHEGNIVNAMITIALCVIFIVTDILIKLRDMADRYNDETD